ncbi:sulfite exporter TauE/SafE family protein [Pikeienuella sp. HZG-20]|uniref:sulfite exporter TauE/SafE family protein n=1 Tax=Paludibacillus litoralis TaxID=3133267 RepID=UPI0030EE821A
MTSFPIDPTGWVIVIGGALIAGFITGFAGFGTVLVASGFWFYALPAPVVPPLLVIASVAGQAVGLVAVRAAFDWRRVAPYLIGAAVGVPLGVLALSHAAPALLRLSVGVFLIAYASFQLSRLTRLGVGAWGGRAADGVVGLGGGFLGGFSGLSGPLPLIWLQLRGGPSSEQRATYQPFNLVVLSFTCVVMALSGKIGKEVLTLSAMLIPLSLFGAWCGVKAYPLMSERGFRRVVLFLLIVSGAVLILQGV